MNIRNVLCFAFIAFATILPPTMVYGATYDLENQNHFDQLCKKKNGQPANAHINGSYWQREYYCDGIFTASNDIIVLYGNSTIKADKKFQLSNVTIQPYDPSLPWIADTTTLTTNNNHSNANKSTSTLDNVTLAGSIDMQGHLVLRDSFVNSINGDGGSVTVRREAEILGSTLQSYVKTSDYTAPVWIENSTILGRVDGRGSIDILGSTVGSDVKGLDSGYPITIENSVLKGRVDSRGKLEITGSTVEDNVNSTDYSYSVDIVSSELKSRVDARGKLTITDSTVGSDARVTDVGYRIDISGSTISGRVDGRGDTEISSSTIMGSVQIPESGYSVTLDSATVKGRVDGRGKITLKNSSTVTGDVQTTDYGYSITADDSVVEGTAQARGDVVLTNTTIYGDAIATDQFYVRFPGYVQNPANNTSEVYGQCLYKTDPDPVDICGVGAMPTPIAQYHLEKSGWNGTAGEVIDEVGNHHGYTVNNPTVGTFDPALVPDGLSMGTCGYGEFVNSNASFIEVPDDNGLDFEGEFAVTSWINPSNNPSSDLYTIVSKDTNYEFHINSAGKVYWYWEYFNSRGNIEVQTLTSQTPIKHNEWTHVAISYTPGSTNSKAKAEIYIDGVLDNSWQASSKGYARLRTNSDTLRIGNDANYTSRVFNGAIDEVQIFDRALNVRQVSDILNQRHLCSDSDIPTQCTLLPKEDFSSDLDNWSVTSYQNSVLPEISDKGRLQLNANLQNQSTAATYQYIFPAKNNLVTIEFDHYADSGSGADGMALVLSDAAVPPQAGAFGGPLGYGQKYDQDYTGQRVEGFAGGWLGIGIDEYGNYSNSNLDNNPVFTPNAVAVRGSGQKVSGKWLGGYDYILGYSGSLLNKGFWNASELDNGEIRRFRVVVASSEQRVLFSLEILGDDGDWDMLIPSTNIMAGYGQAQIPENFRLSLTASTGLYTNYHEIDDVQVCAAKYEPINQNLHHFEFDHTGIGNTCSPEKVTLRACADDACTLYNKPVSVKLAPESSNTETYWVGGDDVSFTGTTELELGSYTNTTAEIGISEFAPDSVPSSIESVRCSVNGSTHSRDNCDIRFEQGNLTLEVSNKYADKWLDGSDAQHPPASIAFCGSQNIDFTYSKNIDFSIQYDNPSAADPYFNQQPVEIEVQNAQGNWQSYTVTESPVSVPVKFDNSGRANFRLNYAEAGRVNLKASYNRGAAEGVSAFVSVPLRLDASVVIADYAAGSEFTYSVMARSYTGSIIKNYQQMGNNSEYKIALGVEVDYPDPALSRTPNLKEVEYEHPMTSSGQVDIVQTVDDVGIFTLTATAPEYLGATDYPIAPARLTNVGRFYPALFRVTGSPAWTPKNGRFAYMNQPFDGIEFQVEALNLNGARVANYDSTKGYTELAGFTLFEDNADSTFAARLNVPTFDSEWSEGLGTFTWNNSGSIDCSSTLCWEKATTQDGYTDGPFNASLPNLTTNISVAGIANPDPVVVDTDHAVLSNQPEIWFGRIRLDSVGGQTSTNIGIPLHIERWNGASFEVDDIDHSSNILGIESHSEHHIWIEEGMTATGVGLSGGGMVSGGHSSSITANRDVSSDVRQQSQVWLDMTSYPWFRYDWSDANATDDARGEQDPSSVVTFGIYRGNDHIIFRGESELMGQ
ncbi:DUF6701 domain-containing protein [Vibrio intestinalis]|uniref:DUF6701 domain-containing protein n=1 Tax=Vibrio intestinalis TaxID=2933291 RepID=UPI0021A87A56|nr:DUF6701 domain-containing protein [Vibrio intestinalis]